MPIERQFDPEKSLLICKVTDELTFDQVADLQYDYFEKYMARNVILDLSAASLKKLNTQDIEHIALLSDSKKDLRPTNSKTAIIATAPLSQGLARMYAIFSELRELTWDLNVVESMDEALDWIGAGDMMEPEDALRSGHVQKGVV